MGDLISMGVHVVNLLLLIGLMAVYLTTYRKFKTKHAAGLLFFSGFFFIETLMALYFDTSMVMFYSEAAELNANALQVVKAIGIAILLWISLE